MTIQDFIGKTDDLDYKQLLMTIWVNLPKNSYRQFLNILKKSEKSKSKIFVDEKLLEEFLWDSLTIDMIKIENNKA